MASITVEVKAIKLNIDIEFSEYFTIIKPFSSQANEIYFINQKICILYLLDICKEIVISFNEIPVTSFLNEPALKILGFEFDKKLRRFFLFTHEKDNLYLIILEYMRNNKTFRVENKFSSYFL